MGPAGSDQLLPVLPATESLTGVFAPSGDQAWLTLGSPADGVIPFSFTANTGTTSRTAHITVLGQQITVTQPPALPSLGPLPLLEGPASGTDSDFVAPTGAWSATSNASWLHTTSSGTGNGLATFTFDANNGPHVQRQLDHRRPDARRSPRPAAATWRPTRSPSSAQHLGGRGGGRSG